MTHEPVVAEPADEVCHGRLERLHVGGGQVYADPAIELQPQL
jgi:hypothetical protein